MILHDFFQPLRYCGYWGAAQPTSAHLSGYILPSAAPPICLAKFGFLEKGVANLYSWLAMILCKYSAQMCTHRCAHRRIHRRTQKAYTDVYTDAHTGVHTDEHAFVYTEAHTNAYSFQGFKTSYTKWPKFQSEQINQCSLQGRIYNSVRDPIDSSYGNLRTA